MSFKVRFDDGQNGSKMVFYLPAVGVFTELKKSLEHYLFEEHKLPKTDLRLFYLEPGMLNHEEIEVINDFDLKIFMKNNERMLHVLHATPKDAKATARTVPTTGSAPNLVGPSEDDPSNFVIHERVECDSCGVGPIVGFRYKCIQCPNFDLCQRCEAQHKHAEHMLMRMPNADSPTFIEAWLTPGGSHKRRGFSKRTPNKCPFMGTGNTVGAENCSTEAGAAAGEQQATGSAGSHHHKNKHERKHHRRQMRQNLFTHFYDIMQDLAEGGATSPPEDVSQSDAKTPENAAKAAEEAAKVAAAAAQTAAEVASKVGPILISAAATSNILNNNQGKSNENTENPINAAHEVAMKVMSNLMTPQPNANTTQNKTDAATSPSTPPTTPDSTADAAPPQATAPPSSSAQATTPVLNFENISQLIDPNFMKMGIDILNNFNGMFAKMIDPNAVDLASAATSASTSAASSLNAEQTTLPAAAETSAAESAPAQEKEKSKSSAETEIDAAASADKTPIMEQTTQRSRSQSEEGDWQVIENQLEANAVHVGTPSPASPSSSSSSTSAASSPGEFVNKPATPKEEMNYAKLGSDLQAHIEAEKKHVVTPPRVARPEEKRAIPVYHTDKRINDSVHAMMAMGFSNEGAWLTQLLETVDGNIPKALDLMNVSQNHIN